MLKALIVDDEAKMRDVLEIKLEKFCTGIFVTGHASNIEEAQNLILENKPDLVFLDIEMPGGTGLDLVEKLNEFNFEIIFVTGYNEYALQALKLSAIDYLLKPIGTIELVQAVNKAKKRIAQKQSAQNFQSLKQNMSQQEDLSKKVAIPNNDSYDFVQITDIIRCEGWNKYTKVYLAKGKVLTSSYSIGTFKDMLEDYGFYSSHKSHLINTAHIKQYLKEGSIVMHDDRHIPVARRRKESFINEILSGNIIR